MKPRDIQALLLLSILWGGSFLFIRVAAPVLGPVFLMFLRASLAGLALLVYVLATRAELEIGRRWRAYLAIGLLNSAIPFVLIATAALHLTAGYAAILNATSPLFGAIVAVVWLKERLTPARLIGLALGLAGVGVLVGLSPLEFSPVLFLSIGASLTAAFFYGFSSVYARLNFKGASPLAQATCSQLAAGLWLLPFVPFALPAGVPNLTVVLAVLGLALFSTALAYLLYFRLIASAGPTRALTVTFLAPGFGVLWGALLLAEPITFSTLLGFGIILAGTGFVTGILKVSRPGPLLKETAHQ